MALTLTTKQRAYLRSLAVNERPVLSIGKEGVTPEVVLSAEEALAKRELIKINVQKSFEGEIKEAAETVASRSRSVLVQIMGRKITLYRPAKKPEIILPKKKDKVGKPKDA
ncbi:MAG: YhbY family RNA-binding protein [Lachnospiraceae bacterium]|nr:YhbY family RNA-binding protein [Lachnospiraceae bacterium]